MFVHEYWKSGYKYFAIDLPEGEARMCLSPCSGERINLAAYDVDGYPTRKVFYVDFLKVTSQYRNNGYGSAVLKAAIRWARVSKNVLILDAIPLDSGIDKHRLVRFYLQHGFRLAKTAKNQHSMFFHDRKKPRSATKRKPVESVSE
jgi:GNAT superfamily N-acetyltransferase